MPEGRFRLEALNRAAETTTATRREDVVGKYMEELVDAESAAIVLSKYGQCARTGSPVQWRQYFDLLHGRRCVESVVYPLYNEQGLFHRIMGVGRDITEQLQIQDALRQSEQDSREVFEHSSDGIFIINVQQDGSFTIAAM